MAVSNSTSNAYYDYYNPPQPGGYTLTAAPNTGGTIQIQNSSGVVSGSWHVQAGAVDSALMEKDLEKDVFAVPVDRLLDIWVTRFGNNWVDLVTIEDDEFFGLAYKRLKNLGELEVHYLTDRARYVCRKPE